MYLVVAEERGIAASKLSGTIQNDILKEYIARGTYIYPPRPSMRLVSDLIAWCAAHLPRWNPISISGYHIREAGANAVQELAFTFADAVAYVDAVIARGLAVDAFAKQLSFFFAANSTLLEEVAKFRAARRVWHRLARERFGAAEPVSWQLRFHTQTMGSTLTAQQPMNNIVRTAIEALAAVLGGTQSLHTNAFDEALGLPTEESVRVALRTQQIIAEESGVTSTVDPFAGAYLVERLTDDIDERVMAEIAKIDEMGGALAGIERGYQQGEIETSAYAEQQAIEERRRLVVGVNAFRTGEQVGPPIQKVDEALVARARDRLRDLRARRDAAAAGRAREQLRAGARGDGEIFPLVLAAVEADVTLGEISDDLREAFGTYSPRT
jgi:methylmalonyl-CoA mutase N-terminal domain/subunit